MAPASGVPTREGGTVRHGEWRRRDRRPGALEEVRRREDLRVVLIRGVAAAAAPGDEHSRVGKQKRGLMVGARHLRARHRRPRLGLRVPDLRGEYRRRVRLRLLRAGGRQHGAVGQDGEGVIRAREGHGAHLPPCRRGLVHVQHVGGRERRRERGVVRPRRAAGFQQEPRPVHDRARARNQGRVDRGPALRSDVQGLGWRVCLVGPGVQDPAIWQEHHRRIERHRQARAGELDHVLETGS